MNNHRQSTTRLTLQSFFGMRWYQLANQIRSSRQFLFRKVEQLWHRLSVWQLRTLDPQLVKELVGQCLHCTAEDPKLDQKSDRSRDSR